MSRTVYLVCGVPGSGKSWVCEQLIHDFRYVSHDAHLPKVKNGPDVVSAVMEWPASEGPFLVDCPFAERDMRERFERLGCTVVPIFIVEPAEVVAQRYQKREGKPPAKATLTRCGSIEARAKEWGAVHGTAEQVLEHLRRVAKEAA